MERCRKWCRTGKRDFSCEMLMISRTRYGRASLSILKTAEGWRCSGSRRIAWSKTTSPHITGFWRARAGCRRRPDVAEKDRGAGADQRVCGYASPLHRLRIGYLFAAAGGTGRGLAGNVVGATPFPPGLIRLLAAPPGGGFLRKGIFFPLIFGR